jgi:hypothetical protein
MYNNYNMLTQILIKVTEDKFQKKNKGNFRNFGTKIPNRIYR